MFTFSVLCTLWSSGHSCNVTLNFIFICKTSTSQSKQNKIVSEKIPKSAKLFNTAEESELNQIPIAIRCSKLLSPYVQTSLVLSVYLTISVSVERYISVVYPLLSIRLHSQTSYLRLSLPALAFSVVFTLPTYFMLDTSCDQVTTYQSKEYNLWVFITESMTRYF